MTRGDATGRKGKSMISEGFFVLNNDISILHHSFVAAWSNRNDQTKQQIMNDEFKEQTFENCDNVVNDIINLNIHFLKAFIL